MTIIERSALVNYSAQEMFEIVNDIEAYPQFMQGCVKAKLVSKSSDIVVANLTLGKLGLQISFTTRNQLSAPHSITMPTQLQPR